MGLGVIALRHMTRGKQLKELSWCTSPVSCSHISQTLGRIESYVRFSESLYYLGGPAALVNGACDTHANSSFAFGRNPPQQGQHKWMHLTDEVTQQSHITSLYGEEARLDWFCACGSPLTSRTTHLNNLPVTCHTPVLQEYKRKIARFNPQATAHTVHALQLELRDTRIMLSKALSQQQ
jgi:hypothetical protein